MKLCYPFKKKLLRVLMIAALLAAAALVIWFVVSKKHNGEYDVFAEGGKSFAVTVNLTGEETKESKRLLYASLKGCGVSASIFCGCDYIEQNTTELSEAVKDGHSICILLELPENANKYELMRFIASENDRFFLLTGKYPAYARTVGKVGSDASQILTTYGQILCNDYVVCDTSGCAGGSIIALESVTSDSVCALTKEITERISSGLMCVSLSVEKSK